MSKDLVVTTNKHKELILPLLKFDASKPAIELEPHVNGRLKVMYQNEWIATIIPFLLDDGEQWGYYQNPYSIISCCNTHEFRGDLTKLINVLNGLQNNGMDWYTLPDSCY